MLKTYAQLQTRGSAVQTRLAEAARIRWKALATDQHPNLTEHGCTSISLAADTLPSIDDLAQVVAHDKLLNLLARAQHPTVVSGNAERGELVISTTQPIPDHWMRTQWRDPQHTFAAPNNDNRGFGAHHFPSHVTSADYRGTPHPFLEITYRAGPPTHRPLNFLERWFSNAPEQHAEIDRQHKAFRDTLQWADLYAGSVHAHTVPFGMHLYVGRDDAVTRTLRIFTHADQLSGLFAAGLHPTFGDRYVRPAAAYGYVERADINALHGIDAHPDGNPIENRPIHSEDALCATAFRLHDWNHIGLGNRMHPAARLFDVHLYDMLDAAGYTIGSKAPRLSDKRTHTLDDRLVKHLLDYSYGTTSPENGHTATHVAHRINHLIRGAMDFDRSGSTLTQDDWNIGRATLQHVADVLTFEPGYDAQRWRELESARRMLPTISEAMHSRDRMQVLRMFSSLLNEDVWVMS